MSSRSLPSRVAPSSRSRSVGRPGREDGGDRPATRSPLPSSPRIPASQDTRSRGAPRPSRDRTDTTRTNSSSTTSSSASGSSFLNRMKVASSRTSLEDNYEEPPKRGGGWALAREREAMHMDDEQFDEEDSSQGPTDSTFGHGYDLWGRVTAVASNLTVNVGQAWQKSIHLADGEETPPGQESRLTKAMKAYHLNRARSPADLPAWLFDEHERGVAPKSWNTSKSGEYEDKFLPERDLESRQRSGLRDIYDRAASSSSSSRTAPTASRQTPAGDGDAGGDGGSRAANRLKAIRDAKRSALQARSESEQPPVEDRRRDTNNSRGDERYPQGGSGRPTAPRVGLPAGPGRMRRQ